MRLQPKLTGYFFLLALLSLLGMSPCSAGRTPLLQAAAVEVPAPTTESLTDEERLAQAHRHAAHLQDVAAGHGRRDTHNLALDDRVTATPWSFDVVAGGAPLLAVDGDANTVWKGSPTSSLWVWNLPFLRVVHLALIRAYFGEASNRGVPSVYRWEYRAPVAGQCADADWQVIPRGEVDDRDPNQFVNGPNNVHVRRQALFTDLDACALRLVISRSEGGPPTLREVELLEGASSVARGPGVRVFASNHLPVVPKSSPEAVLDGKYETLWAGQPGLEQWTLTVRLPEPRTVDRISLAMGLDAVTVPRNEGTGRGFSGAYLPLRYVLESSPDDDNGHLSPIEEAEPPTLNEQPLPTRRRLIHLQPRRIRTLKVTITEATGPLGERDGTTSAPILRDIGLFDAADRRPVVTEPLFLSVDANPSGLTRKLKWGEEGSDGEFARAVSHRLRRAIVGYDVDTGWPADASRRRDNGRGRFLESIEGDDPLLAAPLLQEISPPPVLLLSGSLSFEFDDHTAPPADKTHPWSWNVMAPADHPDRGMGQLIPAFRDRVAPFIGFCGGAHILGLFEAERALAERTKSIEGRSGDLAVRALIDAVLARNTNQDIHPQKLARAYYERAWWYDPQGADRDRPTVTFDATDPLFASIPSDGVERRESRELPLSHVDMLREPAFDSLLSSFHVSAYSEYCSPLVDPSGPDPVLPDRERPEARCVRVPQAFRSKDTSRYPVIGFQFHPEQRDLTRFVPGSPDDARGDAMNIFANAIDLVLDSYVRVFWPGA